MYGDRGGEGGALDDLATVEVAPIADRSGQLLRNELNALLTPRGRPADPRYRLHVKVSESTTLLALARTGLASRADLTINAQYELSDARSRETLLSDRALVTSSYNVIDSDYATLAAENASRTRTLNRIAQSIRSRLGAFFASRRAGAAAAG